MIKDIIDSISLKKIVFCTAMLAVSITLTAQQKPTEQEQSLAQRVYEMQMSGSDSDFYEAHDAFMDYLEGQQDWEKILSCMDESRNI